MTTKPPTDAGAAGPHPVNFSEALGTAIDAARLAAPEHKSADGRTFLTLPRDHVLNEVPDDGRLPPHARATVTLDDRDSLSRYVNRHSTENTIILADYDEVRISARLDWHPHNKAAEGPGTGGACRHIANLVLRPSEEYVRWNKMEGVFHSQQDFAAFLEENAVDIAEPEPATMIELSRDLEATVGQSFKGKVNLDNGDRQFMFTSETRVENGVVVPREFTLQIPLYAGEEPELLRAAFRYRAGEKGLVLAFEWRRVEYQRMAHFKAIATRVSEETGCPVVMGRPAA